MNCIYTTTQSDISTLVYHDKNIEKTEGSEWKLSHFIQYDHYFYFPRRTWMTDHIKNLACYFVLIFCNVQWATVLLLAQIQNESSKYVFKHFAKKSIVFSLVNTIHNFIWRKKFKYNCVLGPCYCLVGCKSNTIILIYFSEFLAAYIPFHFHTPFSNEMTFVISRMLSKTNSQV